MFKNLNCKKRGCCEFEIRGQDDVDIRRTISQYLKKSPWLLMEMTGVDMSLENIFLRLTGRKVDKEEYQGESNFFRELHSYFISPIGYVYLATFYLLAGYQYTLIILNGQADMSVEFSFLYTVVLLLTPILTMRLLSEEKKQKTDQLLFSAPVTLNGIVAGKYFAAVLLCTWE